MDTFINRAQHGYGKLTIVLSCTTVFVALLSLMDIWLSNGFNLPYSYNHVTPKMRWFDSKFFGATNGRPKENARFTFSFNTDLTPLFNWNTKQVYVSVTIDYPSMSSSGLTNSNSLVIWDKIITDPADANITLIDAPSKYSVYDVQNAFSALNREVTLSFHWNVQPIIGLLYFGSPQPQTEQLVVTLPKTSREKKKAKVVMTATGH